MNRMKLPRAGFELATSVLTPRLYNKYKSLITRLINPMFNQYVQQWQTFIYLGSCSSDNILFILDENEFIFKKQ